MFVGIGVVCVSYYLLILATIVKSEVSSEIIEYADEQAILRGFVARSDSYGTEKRPTILVLPDWNGRDDYENNRAIQLAQLGYIGFAVDVYGNGKVGSSPSENSALIEPFLNNRTMLYQRLMAAVNKAKTFVQGNPFQVVSGTKQLQKLFLK